MTKAPVLFVSHDAGATGAPFLLLHLLRWLRANTKLEFSVLLKKTGILESQFAAIAPVAVVGQNEFSGARESCGGSRRFRLKMISVLESCAVQLAPIPSV